DFATQQDMVVILLHELAHGLGFGQPIHMEDFSRFRGKNDVYSQYVLDTTTGKTWNEMTDKERLVSSTNTRKVVWSGINVRNDALKVLRRGGAPSFRVTDPEPAAGNYLLQTATFG